MKKIFLTLCVACASLAVYAAGLDGVRVYVNPGHGSWGPNDRPMATIPYPNLPTTGMPDTCGFYESNTNLWKAQELAKKLRAAGAFVLESRTACGPWDYVYPYADYTYEAYKNRSDFQDFNRPLSEIAAEADANNMDYFISIHSNAATEGTTTNYLYLALRGDGGVTATSAVVVESEKRAKVAWPYVYDAMGKGLEIPSHYTYTSTKIAQQNLGVMKHSVPGWLSEGYFHTYQPARHRALNPDYCREEGLRYYRGIAAYYGLEGAAADGKGYILGAVKDLHEKMSHSLYKYVVKTHDQFVPLNGAVVTLLKGGLEIASYTVDTCYNGLFFFRDLEPGNDYTLEVTCEGYKPLFEEYNLSIGETAFIYHKDQNITVEANATVHPLLFLESETYVPDIVYEDYADQAPSGASLPASFNMGVKDEKSFLIEGTIKRTIGVGDSTIVLSHTADGIAHLYLIDHLTGDVSTISTNGILPVDKENAGELLGLSDIALTADGKLIGINKVVCQYSADYVDAGYKRGVVHLYKWNTLSSNPIVWADVKEHTAASGNFYRAMAGHSLTVSGASNDCMITFTAVNTAASAGMRFTQVAMTDNFVASITYHKPAATADCSPLTQGNDYLLQLSPRDPKNNIILDGELDAPIEIAATGVTHTRVADMDSAALGYWPSEVNFIKYAGKSLLVSPYMNAEKKIAGVRMYDVTDGLDKAVLIETHTDLDFPVTAKFAAATVAVNDADLTIYLCLDNKVVTFSSKAAEQASVKGIYASDLKVSLGVKGYTFSFYSNDKAESANLILYKDGVEAARHAIPLVVEGQNEFSLAATALPGEVNDEFTWAVELKGKVIANWGVLYKEKAVSYTRAFNTVDNSPESDYFGRIYVMDRVGSENSKNGVYVYSKDWKLQNTTNYTGGQSFWRNPTRPAVDSKGTVYFADWGDNHSGVYVANPAQIDGTYTQLFAGTRDSEGVFTHNGASIGSSTPGVHIYGTGKDTKLFVYNEDASGTLPANGVVVYNLGQADGSIASTWDAAPSAVYTLTGQGNSEGNVWGTSHGFFVSQNRTSGNNNTGTTSLKFYDNAGKQQFSSAENGFADIIDGSAGGGYAVTSDESRLILNDGSKHFLVFDITWAGDTPTLALASKYEHGMADIRQMNFDYAGNLIASGLNSGFQIFSVPTENNTTITPAKKALTVKKLAASGEASAITLSAETLTLAAQETATLTATVTPEDVVGLTFTWTSDKPEVATVVNGVVTAIAPGEAKITLSVQNAVMATPLTKECVVTVTATAATRVTLSQKAATLYAADVIKLNYEIAPANTTVPTITWTSSADAVATVVDGVVTAVAPGEARIAIAVQNSAMSEPVTDTCVVRVEEYEAVTGVTLEIADTLVAKGATFTLKETIAPANAVEVLKVWSSDNVEVATILNGVVTAVGAGEANISIRVKSERSAEVYQATCKVKVGVAVTAAAFAEKEVVVTEGKTSTLTLRYAPKDATDLLFTWATSDEKIATVKDGVVTAVAVGEATITVSLKNNVMKEAVTASCKVIVKPQVVPVTSVTLPVTADTLTIGETLTLKATIAPENATTPTITWSTSDEAVATVEDGVVTAVAEGTATITVSVVNEAMTEAVKATCNVMVKVVDGLLTIEMSGVYYCMGVIHNPQGLDLQVFNINGQLVAKDNGDIDMSAMAHGVYIVHTNVGTLKFVK